MSVLEKFIEGMTNQDLPLLESILHEDMFFVQDTTMETKEEWMKDTKEQFANGNFDATKMEISEKFETKDMGALEVTVIEDGHLIRFSNVFLFKDKKIYRQLMHTVNG
tara:strand:+ start:190 stop:513 length:324 start_codon:yes stop_codon:yes gene_type:complete